VGTGIEWTEETWNPVTGCSKVSPGCAHCYAETLTMRYAKSWGVPGLPWTPANADDNVILRPDRLDQPLRWRKPRRVFVNSMSDLFHERLTGFPTEQRLRDWDRNGGKPPSEVAYAAREDEPRRPKYIAQVFAVMTLAERHTFQVLTKRPIAMAMLLSNPNFWLEVNAARLEMCHPVIPGGMSDLASGEQTIPNIWLGTSIENHRYVDRADWLRRTPAAIRFISAEPLLGPLVPPPWASVTVQARGESAAEFDARVKARAAEAQWAAGWRPGSKRLDLTDIDWLIVGGESGPGHRPMKEQWVRELLDAACESGTAFFLKQWGGARPGGDAKLDGRRWQEYPE
jgi:protein gp37